MAKLIGNEVFIDIASKEYPLSLAAIRRKNPHKMFGNAATTDLMRAFGYEVVQQVERPVGDVVTEEAPVKTENGYIQVFSVRAYTQEETAERLAHAKCLFADKVGYTDRVLGDRVRGWAPVEGYDDVCVHFTVMIPESED